MKKIDRIREQKRKKKERLKKKKLKMLERLKELQRNKKNRIKNQKRKKIIEAAIRVYAKRGFYNAKISMIARAAGIADGTVYLYFKSKEDILISIFEEKIETVIKSQNIELEQCKNATEKLISFSRVHLKLIKNNPRLAELLQVELRQSFKFMKKYKPQKFLDYLNIIGDIIDEGRKEGIFRKDIKISVAKIAFFGALDEFSTQWILSPPKNLEIDDAADQICEIFLSGLIKK